MFVVCLINVIIVHRHLSIVDIRSHIYIHAHLLIESDDSVINIKYRVTHDNSAIKSE